MRVREWIIRTKWGADLRSTRWRVLAPSRTLAILNLRANPDETNGTFAPLVSCGVSRKPKGLRVLVSKEG